MRRNAFPSGTGGLGGPRWSFQTPKFVVFFYILFSQFRKIT